MKKQSHASKMDESLGMRRGKESTKKQSMVSRRHESEGAKHAHHKKGGNTALKAKIAKG